MHIGARARQQDAVEPDDEIVIVDVVAERRNDQRNAFGAGHDGMQVEVDRGVEGVAVDGSRIGGHTDQGQ